MSYSGQEEMVSQTSEAARLAPQPTSVRQCLARGLAGRGPADPGARWLSLGSCSCAAWDLGKDVQMPASPLAWTPWAAVIRPRPPLFSIEALPLGGALCLARGVPQALLPVCLWGSVSGGI